ncbi:hypothetical protein D0A35_05350 [Xanthomonas campestris]|nr:hypothetical protein D0A35_05350 [Xanthomonas campestris]
MAQLTVARRQRHASHASDALAAVIDALVGAHLCAKERYREGFEALPGKLHRAQARSYVGLASG